MSVMPRDLALSVLNSLEKAPGFPEQRMERMIGRERRLSTRNRAFAVHLIQGVLRFRLRLDWIIEQTTRFSFRRIEPSVLNILRIALFQIFFMERVPESAAVNEAVKQTKVFGKGHISGFVNGILRQICRNKKQISFPDPQRERLRYLSVYHSYPEWLVGKWIREVGADSVERLLEAGNRNPDLIVRTNRLKISRRDLIARLGHEGIAATPTRYSPDGLKLRGLKGSVTRLSAFREGLFQVQDEAPQICSRLIFPAQGDFLLDLCAGVGGKSTHLAELMRGDGEVLAVDVNRARLEKLRESSRRLGICCIQHVVADAGAKLSRTFNRPFDKILVDAPCSGLGVLSRNPDAKWSKTNSDIRRLARLQLSILREAVALLRKGGNMLYVTCTISKEENEDVVSEFLTHNPEMILEDLNARVPEWGLDLVDDRGFFRTGPRLHEMDGFFAALFRKK